MSENNSGQKENKRPIRVRDTAATVLCNFYSKLYEDMLYLGQ